MLAFYLTALLAAFCVGLSKTGFTGISMVSVVLFADLYGARASVGLALPLLIAADLMAYPAFRIHGSWKPVWKLMAPTLIGLAAGAWMLCWIHDSTARRVIGACVILMVAVQVSRRLKPHLFDGWVESRGFAAGAGFLGGFSTILANAAGPVIQLYLTARRIPKMELIGIGARFFLLINVLKVPLIYWVAMHSPEKAPLIDEHSLLENARLLPAVALGFFGGKWLVRHIPQKAFEWMVIVFAVFAGLRLLVC